MKKDIVLNQLKEAVAEADSIKQSMLDQIEVLKGKRRKYYSNDKVAIFRVEDIEKECNDDTLSILNRKIALLQSAVENFKYSNYDFYNEAAKVYVDTIYNHVSALDDKIAKRYEEASKAIEDARNHMEYLREVEVPSIRDEICNLLEPLKEDTWTYYGDLSGTYVLDNLKIRMENNGQAR